MTDDEKISDYFRQFRGDPRFFAIKVLRVRAFWRKQREIMEAVRDYKYVAVPSCHMGGKTFIASCVAWWFKLCFRPSKVIITSPGERGIKFQTAAEIRARYRAFVEHFSPEELAYLQLSQPPGIDKWIQTEDEFMLWFATTKDQASDHATRIAGFHAPFMLYIFDEAGAISKPIWKGIQGSLMTDNRKLLATGNPSDPNSEFAVFCKRPDVKVIRLNAFEHPNVVQNRKVLPYGPSREGIEDLRRTEGEGSASWMFKVLGVFPTVGLDTLISFEDVQKALERVPKECTHSPATVGIGCDVARFGDDLTVVFAFCNCGTVLELELRQGQDLMATVGLVLDVSKCCGLVKTNAKQIAIDDTGMGGGVSDRLRELGWRVRMVNFGAAPANELAAERYVNVRTELWCRTKDWLKGIKEPGRSEPAATLSGLTPTYADRLRDELICVRYKHASDSRKILEPKADVKKRLGRSPDISDAFCLALYVLPGHSASGSYRSPDETKKLVDPYYERDFGPKRVDSGYAPGGDISTEFSGW